MGLKISTVAFVCADKAGRRVRINRGDSLDAKDPIVKLFPDNFADPDEFAERFGRRTMVHTAEGRVIEQASAAPGERRSVQIPSRSKRRKGKGED